MGIQHLKKVLVLMAAPLVWSCGSYQYAKPEKSLLPANDAVQAKKVINFRSLGEIQNKEGKTIKSDFFYRSGHLGKLRKKSFAALEERGIVKVIDLRTTKEAEDKKDKLPASVQYIHLPAFEDKEDQLTQARKLVLKGKVKQEDAENRMLEFYRTYLTENPTVIREIIQEILNSDEPILFHCTAGKDRTGMIAMLLFEILGFDRSSIEQEYLLSNNQREKVINKRLKTANRLHFIFPKMDLSILEKLSWIELAYLNEAYKSVSDKYGSMDQYIEEALGISSEQRENYRLRFTK